MEDLILENQNAFDGVFDPSGPGSTVNVPPKDTKTDFAALDELFTSMIGPEIKKIIELQDKFQSKGQYSINRDLTTEFLEKLFSHNCPSILKLNAVEQQVYLLYLTANLFMRYNDNVLGLNKDEYIDRIYFTNILSICARHLVNARRLIHRVLKNVYADIETKSHDIIEFYAQLYQADGTVIKNDTIQMFFINLFYKFNPLDMEDIEEFYSGLFRKILYFYLKHKISGVKNCDVDPSILSDTRVSAPSERYRIYEEALYLVQIQNMCSDSGTINRISQQYDKMRTIIIPNELQRLYLYTVSEGKLHMHNEKAALLRMHTELSRMEKIKTKLPQIYRLLRSVQVISDNKTFLDNDVTLIRHTVSDVLHEKFNAVLTNDIIKPVIHNITETFVSSLTSGEFIDMVTLTPINLSGQKFNEQLREFLEIVLSGLGNDQLG